MTDGQNGEVKEQILQVSGDKVGEIVIIPKGMKSEDPLVAAASLASKNVELETQIKTLNDEKAAMSAEVKELKEKLSEFEQATVKAAATELVDKRVEAGLTDEKDKAKELEQFSALTVEQINTLKTDAEKMSAFKKKKEEEDNAGDPESAGRDGENTGGEEKTEAEKMSALRMELFGHKEPIGEKKE